MISNELKFAEKIVNFNENIKNIQSYIKENFNTESKFNEDEMKFNIWTTNIQDSLRLIAAKDYINEQLNDYNVEVEYKKGDN